MADYGQPKRVRLMRPLKQQFEHLPAEGCWGDCHRAAIASVLELDLDQVPHFGEAGPSAEEFRRREIEFLASHGIRPIAIPFLATEQGPGPVLNLIGEINGDDFVYLLGGKSRHGLNHSVVCVGRVIAHDPSNTNAGIVGPFDDGFYWLTFFGSLESGSA